MLPRRRRHLGAANPMGLAASLLLVAWTAWCPQAAAEQTIYRYINASGRPSFVNELRRVPKAHRAEAKAVDLSRISTNRVLGEELQRAVDESIERLTASGYCLKLRKGARVGWFTLLWRRHGHLLVIAAVVLLLIGVSPWITARMPGPQWGRILLMVLPVLAMLALWTTAVVKTSRSSRLLRKAAAPCRPETYRALPNTPAAQRKRLGMLGRLQADIRDMHKRRNALLDAALEEGAGGRPTPTKEVP